MVHFAKTKGLIAFPKIIADIFGTRNDIFINPKSTGIKFLISRKLEVNNSFKKNRRGLKAFQTDNLQNDPLGAPDKNPVPIKLSINKKEEAL